MRFVLWHASAHVRGPRAFSVLRDPFRRLRRVASRRVASRRVSVNRPVRAGRTARLPEPPETTSNWKLVPELET